MAWYIHAGLMLGYREREVWRMTPRKIFALYTAHIKHVETCGRIQAAQLINALGGAITPRQGGIDDAIPPDDC